MGTLTALLGNVLETALGDGEQTRRASDLEIAVISREKATAGDACRRRRSVF
jgi:hypothetical protein